MNPYPYKCACGRKGFIDIGKEAGNRYPCAECFAKILEKREENIKIILDSKRRGSKM